MRVSEVEKALTAHTGGCFITRVELQRAMNYKDAHCVDRYLDGLHNVNKKYLIKEVAQRICDMSKI